MKLKETLKKNINGFWYFKIFELCGYDKRWQTYRGILLQGLTGFLQSNIHVIRKFGDELRETFKHCKWILEL